MNINKLRKTIEQMKLSLLDDDNACSCGYVEIGDYTSSLDNLKIIENNKACRIHELKHYGYAYVQVAQINVQDESGILIN